MNTRPMATSKTLELNTLVTPFREPRAIETAGPPIEFTERTLFTGKAQDVLSPLRGPGSVRSGGSDSWNNRSPGGFWTTNEGHATETASRAAGDATMATTESQMISPGISRWWRVVGGLSMNLALGTLYAWSVFVAPLEKQFGWKRAETSMVFTIAVMVFALSFVLAGRIQDKFGPFYCSLAGGVLVSLGFFLCSYTTSLTYLFICFGVIGGLGNGFGYATPIPVMAKWFPDKRGLAIGLAVG